MPQKIRVYQFGPLADQESASPFCVKVHYALGYKKLPFDVENVATPMAARKLNPAGKLPVIQANGALVADSTEILRLIEREQPEPRLYPQDAAERARAEMIEDWADESLYWHIVYERWLVDEQFEQFAGAMLASIAAPLRPLVKMVARRQTRAQLVGQGLGRLDLKRQREKLSGSLGWIENLLDGHYLCGTDLTAADIAVAAQVAALTIPITPWASSEVRKRGNLMRWLALVQTAVGRAVAG